VDVRTTQELVESLGARIERAYRLRRGGWNAGCSTARVWSAAALTLLKCQREHPALPLDPELYVASQPLEGPFPDPWEELTQPASVRRYRVRVWRIVRVLQAELRGEVGRAERQVRRGKTLEKVLSPDSPSLSPLGCYIVARRAGRADLAKRFRAEAHVQHLSCPLYRQASAGLLAPELYPTSSVVAYDAPVHAPPRCARRLTSLN
jgi:hypothetical protein